MEKKIDEILGIVKSLESKVSDLWKFNNMDSYHEFPPLLQSQSPIRLTPLGESILQTYQGAAHIDAVKENLISEIHKRDFKSPLDIQDFSEKIIISKFNSDEFVAIKNYIYNNPYHENQAVTIKTMSLVMGIYLRDKYFERHPEKLKID